MARPAVQTGNLIEGKWLCCANWWLIPYTPEAGSALRRARQLVEAASKSAGRRPTDSQKPDEIHRLIMRLGPEIQKEKIGLYNAQPRWALCDIQVNSSSEGHQVVEEFLRLVRFAAAEFCWTMNQPVSEMDWKQHGWKHTTFQEIESIIEDVKAGHWLPPELRADLIGSAEEAEALFQMAGRNEPEAVARLDFLFPSRADKFRVAEANLDTTQNPYVPTPELLAAAWVRTAVRHPDSDEAEVARNNLRWLVSKRAAKGSRSYGGRPASPHHEETVKTIWMMCYSMCKQLREVGKFLQKCEPDEQKRRNSLGQSYPWVSALMRTDFVPFLKLGNTGCALEFAGKLLGISPSKVAKVVHSRQSRS